MRYNKNVDLSPESFSQQDIESIFSKVRGGWQGQRLKGLLATWLGTGIRITEALDLLPRDVKSDHLIVRRGKGGKPRKPGFRSIWRPHLENWIRLRKEICTINDESPVFCGKRGQPWQSANVRQMLIRLRRKMMSEGELEAGRRIHPHGFRHTHAFDLMKGGASPMEIRQQLGHNSLSTTTRYLDHICPQHLFDAVREL